MTTAGPPQTRASPEILTRGDLLALIPHGSRVEYSTTDKTICVIHDPSGGVVAILSDRTPGPVARRARLIACIPRLLSECSDSLVAELATCIATEPDNESSLWGRATPRTQRAPKP